MELVVFYSLSAVTVLSALAVVLLRNVLHSSLFLGLALAGVAGLFASLGADFLFAVQILVYVSGVAVLVVFVVMLAGRASELRRIQVNKQWVGALVVCGIIFCGMRSLLSGYGDRAASGMAVETTRELGRILIGRSPADAEYGLYALPFELISLILIVSLLGAILFTSPEADRLSPQSPQGGDE